MNIQKINVEHKELISRILSDKFEAYTKSFKYIPKGRIDIDKFVNNILDKDGYIINIGHEYGFISMTYAGELFYGRQGLYHAEWAHYFPSNPVITEALLNLAYDYMTKNHLRDHTISYLNNRQDLSSLFFEASYGGRCLDAHTKIDPQMACALENIRQASMKDIDALVPLLDEHHDYMNDVSRLGMNFSDSRTLLSKWLQDESSHILVYEEDQILAMMMLVDKSSGGCTIGSDDTTLGIKTTQVMSKHQGKGIGLSLLKHAHDYGLKNGYKILAVDFESFNFSAYRFWSKHFDLTIRSVIRNIG
ncbi:GNAT family N-acetyltransferase [Acidaminobacter sp. JC074]|uniref:GNAT family N-acetyltransferase n=1 Tax=Acidaminobacter sp. JC074 TaxID=2530199 RepID=UPI001F10FA88|nr:GNAT family N-acetyltransferase [Acidaminobacter sp. JC074]MCH4889766.1 GNAT family N-acetyltransferase [Acidaminobacter sp. JC074]